MYPEDSETEDTKEREQSEITRDAERQSALRTRERPSEEAKRRKRKETIQEAAERKAAKKRHPDTEKYFEDGKDRHSDSSHSSHHQVTAKGRARNRVNESLPEQCDWPAMTGTDDERGYLHEERNRDRSRSASYNRVVKTPTEE